MILDAAETVLGYFGFDRTVYGGRRNKTPRRQSWMQELIQERANDVNAEIM